jgi:hypothetical protein
MSGFVFDHYVPVAQITIASILPLMLVAYIAVVALGMSSDIKHLSPIGIAHALIAFAIAVLAARRLSVRAGWLLLVPCLLMLVVVLFNLANDDVGLELMGRWNRSG